MHYSLVGLTVQLLTLQPLMPNLLTVVIGACEGAQIQRHRTLNLNLLRLKHRCKSLLFFFLLWAVLMTH